MLFLDFVAADLFRPPGALVAVFAVQGKLLLSPRLWALSYKLGLVSSPLKLYISQGLEQWLLC
jgi:hypothetical protein